MNLHGLVSGAIGIVNPFVTATLQRSTGYTTAGDGGRTPTYSTSTESVQVQALSGWDLQHLDGLNLNGVLRKVFLNGDWRGVYRPGNQGGDHIKFGATGIPATLQNTDWLVVHVLETWPDWCSLVIQLQMT